jgi:hypothetical protein
MTLHQLGILIAITGLLIMGWLYTQQPRDLGSVEQQCVHQNKFHWRGEYGECPNQRPLRVYR